MIIRPICIVRQIGDMIELHINSYKYGHTMLHWYKSGNPDHEKSMAISSPDMKISNVSEEGYYCFYTTNIDGERSAVIEIYLLKEDLLHYIDSIMAAAPDSLPDKTAAGEIRKKLISDFSASQETRVSATIMRYMMEREADMRSETMTSYYDECYTAERYENLQNASWNQNISMKFKLDYTGGGTLTSRGFFSKIAEYDSTGRLIRTIHCFAKEKVPLCLGQEGAYTLKLFIGDDLVNVLSFIHFNPVMAAHSWKNKVENTANRDMICKSFNISHSDVDLTDEELKNYAVEREANPKFPVVPRISIISRKGPQLEVCINGYEKLRAMNRPFNLAIKEDDLMYVDYFTNLLPITSEKMTFNCARSYLESDIVIYVQDSEERPISNMLRVSFENDYTEYYVKQAQIEIEDYQKRMSPLIEYRFPVTKRILPDLFTTAINMETIPPEDMWLSIVAQIMHSHYTTDWNAVASAIIEEWNNNQPYSSTFFSQPLLLYTSENRLVIPPREKPYAAICCSLNPQDSTFKQEAFASSTGAVSIPLWNHMQYIIYCIDSASHQISGTFFINREMSKDYIACNNIVWERR